MTPEELAACAEAIRTYKLCGTLYGTDGFVELIFAAGLSHARAESVKEIASLKDKLFLAQKEIGVLRSWLGENK